MKKLIALVGVLLVIAGALAVAFTPDILSLLIISLMCLILLLGFSAGMVPLMLYADGLRTARGNIVHLSEISTDTPWVALQQLEYFFHQKTLDGLFALYRSKINEQQKEDQVPSDIEDVINEEALALRSWQNVVNQIPGTMTALGLLGTFLGLIVGISSISFSSVDATINSIETVLQGIDVAFYTSIVGVIFSMLFNLTHKLLWNILIRELGLFTESFHMYIMPSAAEQTRLRRNKEMQQILERLERLPKNHGYMPAAAPAAAVLNPGNEQRLMPEIQERPAHLRPEHPGYHRRRSPDAVETRRFRPGASKRLHLGGGEQRLHHQAGPVHLGGGLQDHPPLDRLRHTAGPPGHQHLQDRPDGH